MPDISGHTQAMQDQLTRPDPAANIHQSGLSSDLDAALRDATATETISTAPGALLTDPKAIAQLQADQAKAADIAGWREAVLHAVPMIESLMPEFKAKVTRDQWGAFGEALGAACVHYGLGIGAAFNHPLVQLAIVTFPIGKAMGEIKRDRIAAAVAQQRGVLLPEMKPAAVKKGDGPELQTPGAMARSDHPGVSVRVMDETQAPS
jgi:hypothetical protein